MLLYAAFFWIALCIIVAIAANTRGRSPIGWFFCAMLISPLIGGLLLLALPQLEIASGPIRSPEWFEERQRRRAIVAWIGAAVLVSAAALLVLWGFRMI
jgi:hypothetical protein